MQALVEPRQAVDGSRIPELERESASLRRQIPGLEIKEQRSRRFQSPELRCFSDATLAEQNQLHALFLAHALVGGNDWKSHHATSRSS